jgi:hypothetical protein
VCLCSFADSCWVLPGLWWLHCIHLHHPDYRPASPCLFWNTIFCLSLHETVVTINFFIIKLFTTNFHIVHSVHCELNHELLCIVLLICSYELRRSRNLQRTYTDIL